MQTGVCPLSLCCLKGGCVFLGRGDIFACVLSGGENRDFFLRSIYLRFICASFFICI